jgi:hypothetical protein
MDPRKLPPDAVELTPTATIVALLGFRTRPLVRTDSTVLDNGALTQSPHAAVHRRRNYKRLCELRPVYKSKETKRPRECESPIRRGAPKSLSDSEAHQEPEDARGRQDSAIIMV